MNAYRTIRNNLLTVAVAIGLFSLSSILIRSPSDYTPQTFYQPPPITIPNYLPPGLIIRGEGTIPSSPGDNTLIIEITPDGITTEFFNGPYLRPDLLPLTTQPNPEETTNCIDCHSKPEVQKRMQESRLEGKLSDSTGVGL